MLSQAGSHQACARQTGAAPGFPPSGENRSAAARALNRDGIDFTESRALVPRGSQSAEVTHDHLADMFPSHNGDPGGDPHAESVPRRSSTPCCGGRGGRTRTARKQHLQGKPARHRTARAAQATTPQERDPTVTLSGPQVFAKGLQDPSAGAVPGKPAWAPAESRSSLAEAPGALAVRRVPSAH